ncbi:MAG: T9SS type A sorting domain-containing protein [Candidatus Azobacteroides sp.]|nr:T9SS type A sorting domain-containing protein [Candidatus Azobacteroides sp.]
MKKRKQSNKWIAVCILCSLFSISQAFAVVYPWDLTEWIKTSTENPVTSGSNLANLFDNDLSTEYEVSGNSAIIEIELENNIFLSGWAIKVSDGATSKLEYKKDEESGWKEVPPAMVYPSESSGVAPFPVPAFTIGEEDGFLFYGSDKSDEDIRSDDGLRHFRLTVEGENVKIAEWQMFGAPRRANADNYRHYPEDLFSEYAPGLGDWELTYEDPNLTYSHKGDYGEVYEIFNKWGGSRWNIEPGSPVEEVGMYVEYTFPEAIVAGSYAIQAYENSSERTPNGWKVAAKNEGDADWTVLHEVSDFVFPFPYKEGWNDELGTDIQIQSSPVMFVFNFDVPGIYTTYRLEITQDLSKGCLELGQFSLYAAPDSYVINGLDELIVFNQAAITGEIIQNLTIRGNDITQEEINKVKNRVAEIAGTITWEGFGKKADESDTYDYVTSTEGFFDAISCKGSIILKDLPELSNPNGFKEYTVINGDFVIDNCPSFNGLNPHWIQDAWSKLEEIKGDYIVRGITEEGIAGYGRSLKKVEGNFEFSGNTNSFWHFMDSYTLEYIGGDLILTDNEPLESLSGLENLAYIGGNVTILNNAVWFAEQSDEPREDYERTGYCLLAYFKMAGVIQPDAVITVPEGINMEDLKPCFASGEIGNYDADIIIDGLAALEEFNNGTRKLPYNNVTIQGTDITQQELTNAAGVISEIFRSVTWNNMPLIATTVGFFDEIPVAGSIMLKNCPALNDLSGLHGYKNIQGDFVAHNIGVVDLRLEGTEEIQGNLDVQDNNQLVALNGLEHIKRIGGNVTFLNNKIPMFEAVSGNNNIGMCLLRELMDNGIIDINNTILLSDENGNPLAPEDLRPCSEGLNNLLVLKGGLLTLYPNPVKDKLYIQSDGFITGVRIINLIGQCVLSLNSVAGEIDLSSLEAGNYILVVAMENEKEQQYKIIKL